MILLTKTCQRCGHEYTPDFHDRNSKYCPQCRIATKHERKKAYYRSAIIRRVKKDTDRLNFYLEYEAWKRDFYAGKTISNL